MQFGQKHLSDPFYTEKSQRISARDHIVRELASNMLIHREYRNAFPAKFIIERNRIYVENSNKPHGFGAIDLQNFTPYPKNPTIERIFKEIGHADELGSGTRNLNKYGKLYSDQPIELIEGDIFKTIVHVADQASDQFTDQAAVQDTMQVTMQAEQRERILEFCKTPKTRKEIQKYLGFKSRDYFRKEILNPLVNEGLLTPTIPDKPKSPNQKYNATNPEKSQ
ncbi:MAG: hypothetical protein IIB45_04130 [Candidatus Marinimicrobia bacterium]|nr:hypothetical protein [Candidatus Neomarinimicrobiota bacterium]